MRAVMRRGVTLIELVVTVTVLAILSGSMAPTISSGVDAYAAARDARDAAEQASFAVGRCVRFFREVPAGGAAGEVGISTAQADHAVFSDGSALSLSGQELMMTRGGVTAPLAVGVDGFALAYIGEDGSSDVSESPVNTHTVRITLSVAGVEFRGVAFCRARLLD